MSFFKRKSLFSKYIKVIFSIIFMMSSTGIGSYASVLPYMAEPGALMAVSVPFTGPALIGMRVYPEDPLTFSFLLGQGDATLNDQEATKVSEKLIRYFLAGLAIPENDLWVNLSPYEDDRIISIVLGRTEIGHDMLGQDYLLKQMTASLTYPESELGKKFWDTVYEKAEARFGEGDIPQKYRRFSFIEKNREFHRGEIVDLRFEEKLVVRPEDT